MQTVCELKIVCNRDVRLNADSSCRFKSMIVSPCMHVLKRDVCGDRFLSFFLCVGILSHV